MMAEDPRPLDALSDYEWGARQTQHRLLREALAAARRGASWLERAAGHVDALVNLLEEAGGAEGDRLRLLVPVLMRTAQDAAAAVAALRRGRWCRDEGLK